MMHISMKRLEYEWLMFPQVLFGNSWVKYIIMYNDLQNNKIEKNNCRSKNGDVNLLNFCEDVRDKIVVGNDVGDVVVLHTQCL